MKLAGTHLQLLECVGLGLPHGGPAGQVLLHELGAEVAVGEVDQLLGRLRGQGQAVRPGQHQLAPRVLHPNLVAHTVSEIRDGWLVNAVGIRLEAGVHPGASSFSVSETEPAGCCAGPFSAISAHDRGSNYHP